MIKRLHTITEKILDRRWLTIGIIFVMALSLRAVRPLVVDRISKDSVLYVYMAEDIASGNINKAFERNSRMPPLYPFMMSGLVKTGIPMEASGIIISIIAGALLVIPVYLITEMIFRSGAAAMAAFLVAFNPDLIESSGSIMRESLYLVLLFSAIYFVMKAMESGKWNLHFWSLGGVCASLGAAVRTETLEVPGAAVVCIAVEAFILVRGGKQIGASLCRRAAGMALLLVMYYIASLPLSNALEGTSSTWSIIDKRIPGYLRTMMKASGSDVLKAEDTL
jgi:4-amino-4-deoxy-L-arabinose transferase-like glycosyltransferase